MLALITDTRHGVGTPSSQQLFKQNNARLVFSFDSVQTARFDLEVMRSEKPVSAIEQSSLETSGMLRTYEGNLRHETTAAISLGDPNPSLRACGCRVRNEVWRHLSI
jgi:hypothetical protein